MNPSAPPFNLSPRRTVTKPDWTITSDEVEQGCILWLGTPAETFESQTRRGAPSAPVINAQTRLPANEGMYEHPFLVLSRPETDPSKIYFLPMTSLGNQTLATKFTLRKASYHQSTFLPVTPAEPHPLYLAGNLRYRTLTLENGDQLEKSTYVNVREVYEMDWRDAQLYWGNNPNLRKKWRLDGPSMQAVLSLVSTNLKITVGRQYSPTSTRQSNFQSQLFRPPNRRLSNHYPNNDMNRSRTIPMTYRPATPPQPFPHLHRSPTSPIRRPGPGPPAIHPILQAEFAPRTMVQEGQRLKGSFEAQRSVEERQPLLLSPNPQSPDKTGEGESEDGGWCIRWKLLCPCC